MGSWHTIPYWDSSLKRALSVLLPSQKPRRSDNQNQRCIINETNISSTPLSFWRISLLWTCTVGSGFWYYYWKELTFGKKKQPCGDKEFVLFSGWLPQDSLPISSIWYSWKMLPWWSWQVPLDVTLCEAPDGPSVMSSLPRFCSPPSPSPPVSLSFEIFLNT